MLSSEGTYRSPCRSRKDTFLFLRNVVYFLSVSYFSLSVSLGKCSISFLNLHENILKGGRDLIKATFLELLINIYPQNQKQLLFIQTFSLILMINQLQNCSACVLEFAAFFFLLNLATYNTPFSSESHSLEQMEEGYILPQVGRYLGKQWAFLKHAVLYKIL